MPSTSTLAVGLLLTATTVLPWFRLRSDHSITCDAWGCTDDPKNAQANSAPGGPDISWWETDLKALTESPEMLLAGAVLESLAILFILLLRCCIPKAARLFGKAPDRVATSLKQHLASIDAAAPRIGIIGGGSLRGDVQKYLAWELTRALDEAIGGAAWVIMTSSPAVQAVFVKHSSDRQRPRVVHLVPDGESSDFHGGEDFHAGPTYDSCKDVLRRSCDVYIWFNDGDKTTKQEAEDVQKRGAGVVPLDCAEAAPDALESFAITAVQGLCMLLQKREFAIPIYMGRSPTEVSELLRDTADALKTRSPYSGPYSRPRSREGSPADVCRRTCDELSPRRMSLSQPYGVASPLQGHSPLTSPRDAPAVQGLEAAPPGGSRMPGPLARLFEPAVGSAKCQTPPRIPQLPLWGSPGLPLWGSPGCGLSNSPSVTDIKAAPLAASGPQGSKSSPLMDAVQGFVVGAALGDAMGVRTAGKPPVEAEAICASQFAIYTPGVTPRDQNWSPLMSARCCDCDRVDQFGICMKCKTKHGAAGVAPTSIVVAQVQAELSARASADAEIARRPAASETSVCTPQDTTQLVPNTTAGSNMARLRSDENCVSVVDIAVGTAGSTSGTPKNSSDENVGHITPRDRSGSSTPHSGWSSRASPHFAAAKVEPLPEETSPLSHQLRDRLDDHKRMELSQQLRVRLNDHNRMEDDIMSVAETKSRPPSPQVASIGTARIGTARLSFELAAAAQRMSSTSVSPRGSIAATSQMQRTRDVILDDGGYAAAPVSQPANTSVHSFATGGRVEPIGSNPLSPGQSSAKEYNIAGSDDDDDDSEPPSVDSPTQDGACHCGHGLEKDADFCRKCGMRRQALGSCATEVVDAQPYSADNGLNAAVPSASDRHPSSCDLQ